MYLEKIEIVGFKSFAEKTVLKFSTPITSIVGPNGCGKSNIVDAFRWILGESARSLRSEKMVDVIFAGTTKRKPLNYAQIAITFSKVDTLTSLNTHELCISRKLYRSGESEWTINKNPVRLKDIHKVLWEVGIGKNAFFIFEQGKVDDLVTSSPIERRCIFEEAAKIMHFKERKKEALRKLTHVETNLKRVFDIQNEVNSQVEVLQKQAQEAQIFIEKKALLEKNEKELVIYKWQHNYKKNERFEELLKENKNAVDQKKSELKEIESTLKELKIEQQKKTLEAKAAYEAYFEIKKSNELISFEFKNHKKNEQELFGATQVLIKSHSQLKDRLDQEQKNYVQNQTKLKEFESKRLDIRTNLNEIDQIVVKLEKNVGDATAYRKDVQQKLILAISQENEVVSLKNNTDTKLLSLKESLQAFIDRESHSKKTLTQKRESLKVLQEGFKKQSTEFEVCLKNINNVDLDITDQSKVCETFSQRLKVVDQEFNQLSAKVELLKSLKLQLEGYNKSCKELLKHSSESKHSLYQKVYPITDWIVPNQGSEDHLATILKPYLQTLVVKSNLDLGLVLEHIEKQNLKDVSIICLEDLPTAKALEKSMTLKENILANHFLTKISSLDSKNSPAKNTIYKEKYFCDEMLVLHLISKNEQNLFSRESELSSSLNKLQIASDKLAHLEQELKVARDKLQFTRNEKSSLIDKKQNLEKTKVGLDLNIKKESEAIKDLQSVLSEADTQKSDLVQLSESLSKKQQELYQKSLIESKNRQELEETCKKTEKEFDQDFGTLKEKRSLKTMLDQKSSAVEKGIQKIQEDIKVFESTKLNFEEQMTQLSQTLKQKEEELKILRSKNDSYIAKENSLKQNLQSSNTHYQNLEEAVEVIEKQEIEHNLTIKNIREHLEQATQKEIELKTNFSESLAQLKMHAEEILDKYEIDENTIINITIDADISIQRTDKEIKKLRRDLADYTEINLKAMSECEKQKERFEFLGSQIEDLEKSKQEFLDIITELDDTSRKMFQETFEKIRHHFKENFTLLFEGGEADIKFTSNEDILDAGIEIIAQPPGKKMKSMQLMSGGEKCLTAIALLFALFETQSIPFCILDEIDAPLDDTNISRFTKVVKQFVKNHQFIIITHNKRTMAIADTLLGVSMQEKGVTKIIPFEFDKNVKLEPAETAKA